MNSRVLFIDRDGTLVAEPADCQVDRLDKVRLLRDVIPALLRLQAAGYRLVMVSNQDGLGTTSFPQEDFDATQKHILDLFETQGIQFDEIFICPHLPEERCECRKPRTGLLSKYLAATSLDTENSAVIGDRDTDMQLAANLGVRGLRVSQEDNPAESWQQVCRDLLNRKRSAAVERTTRETSIRAAVDLDSTDPVIINTGIGFYDHMLEQVSRHGGFSLQIECDGDLQVDEHHTVEDTAICLGSAMREAIGDKRGIGRYGFVLPMDESEARVSIDLSGRASFRFKGTFDRESVGGLPTELVPHFFLSFADALGAALHVEVTGDNAHHMIEACFKCVGRALRQAIRVEGDGMPSTKGTLA